MTDSTLPTHIQLGFLTVFAEAGGYMGGYLVTNSWGRPLEFRLSTAVQPNKVQQILYGSTLTDYLCSDLIGKALIDKTGTPAHILVTDSLNVLPIRQRLDIPVIGLVPEEQLPAFNTDRPLKVLSHPRAQARIVIDARQGSEEMLIRTMLDRTDPAMELSEPFARIREAMGEARKMGVTSRAA
jgi:hypothetical protein